MEKTDNKTKTITLDLQDDAIAFEDNRYVVVRRGGNVYGTLTAAYDLLEIAFEGIAEVSSESIADNVHNKILADGMLKLASLMKGKLQ